MSGTPLESVLSVHYSFTTIAIQPEAYFATGVGHIFQWEGNMTDREFERVLAEMTVEQMDKFIDLLWEWNLLPVQPPSEIQPSRHQKGSDKI